jgi:hypothetical protein
MELKRQRRLRVFQEMTLTGSPQAWNSEPHTRSIMMTASWLHEVIDCCGAADRKTKSV